MPGPGLSAGSRDVLPSLSGRSGQLGWLAGNVFAGGLVIGTTISRGEIVIELTRAVPTRVTLLCDDAWLARLLTIRSAGMGANVVIATDRPGPWENFVNLIGGRQPIAAVRTNHRSALPAPSVAAPLVVIEDTREVPPETYAPRLAWQSTIHVRAGVNEASRALLDASHIVLVCPLGSDAPIAVSNALGLGEHGAGTVAALGEREVLVIAGQRAHRVSVMPTPTERRMM